MNDTVKKKAKNGLYIEALLTKLALMGKTGIRLPIREKDKMEQKYLGFLKQLAEKRVLSQKTYKREVEARKTRTLSDELYDEFWSCFKTNESGLARNVGRTSGLRSR